MAVFNTIANSVRTVLASIPGSPTVEVRKDDAMFGGETQPIIIVTMGSEDVVRELSGAGSATDLGDILKSYQIAITIYRVCLGDIATDMTLSPDYILAAKQVLNKVTLAGASTVYDTKLVENQEWEHRDFGEGNEVSRFGIIFYSSETRLGN